MVTLVPLGGYKPVHLILLERNIVLEGARAEAHSPRTCLGEKQRRLGILQEGPESIAASDFCSPGP